MSRIAAASRTAVEGVVTDSEGSVCIQIMEELAERLPDGIEVLAEDPLFPICKIRGRARD